MVVFVEDVFVFGGLYVGVDDIFVFSGVILIISSFGLDSVLVSVLYDIVVDDFGFPMIGIFSCSGILLSLGGDMIVILPLYISGKGFNPCIS